LQCRPVRVERLRDERPQPVPDFGGSADVGEVATPVDADVCVSDQARIDGVVLAEQAESEPDVVFDREAGDVVRVAAPVQEARDQDEQVVVPRHRVGHPGLVVHEELRPGEVAEHPGARVGFSLGVALYQDVGDLQEDAREHGEVARLVAATAPVGRGVEDDEPDAHASRRGTVPLGPAATSGGAPPGRAGDGASVPD
jgi:hypothetical protein